MVEDLRTNDSSRQDDDSDRRDHRRKLTRDADLTSPDSRNAFDNKNDKDESHDGLPRLEIAPVRSLSGTALKESAEKLHDSIMHENTFGLNDAPQESRVRAILEPLSKADRQALERTYHNLFNSDGPPDTLRHDLEDKLSGTEFRKAEAILNREDGRANDAGELRVALSQLGDDAGDGNASILQTFSTLNSRDIATMRSDYQKYYGESMDTALANADGLSDSTKMALPLLMKGSDKRTPQENVDMANVAADAGDQTLLSIALRGDTESARGAREKLKNDDSFKSKLETNFYGNRVVTDYLQEGRISLKTIADESQGGFLGFGENKDNFELALKNISPEERKQYLAGKSIEDSKQCPAGKEEQDNLDYYKKIRDGLNDLGDDREVSRWEDMIAAPSGTLISRMAEQHDSHDKVFGAVENMSEADWKRLNDKESGAQYRKDLQESASTYLDDDEEARLSRLLDAKLAAPNFAASQRVSQPLIDIVNEGDAAKIADGIMHLNASDRKEYQSNDCYRQQIDDKLKDMDGEGGVLVRHLMSQVKADGSLPQLDTVDQVLYDKVNKAPSGQFLKDAEVALQDPNLRARLSTNENLTERESALRSSISGFINDKEPAAQYGARYTGVADPEQNEDFTNLLKNGRLSLDVQKNLDVPLSYLYTQLPSVSEDERNSFIDGLEDDSKVVAHNAFNQGGKLSLADQLRSYIIDGGTEWKTFIDPLKETANQPEELEKLKKEYAGKYDHDLSDDLADKLGDADERTMLNLLNPSGVPVREDFYHILQENHVSGISPDGTEMTMQKSVDDFAATLEKYQSQFKEMPDAERERLNRFFSEAQEQYKESKAAFAKFVVNAVLVGGAVVAAPFTGGLSMAGVAAIAAAGAAFRTGATWAIEGDDFDSSPTNVLKESFLGAAQTGSTFIGPSAFVGATSIGKEAAEHATTALVSAEGKELLKEGAEQGLQKELQTTYLNATVRGEDITKEQWQSISAKFLKEGASDEDKARLAAMLEQTSNREIKQASETYLLESIKQKGKAEVREAAFNSGTATATNVGYNFATAPITGLDGEELKDSVILGAAGGGLVGPIFKGAFHPASEGTERLFGAPGQRITKKLISNELDDTSGRNLLARLRSGDRVSFADEPGWKVQGFDADGNLLITHDAERQVSVNSLKEVNGNKFHQQGLEPGARYAIREDGHVSDGWQVDSLDMSSGDVNVVKIDAKRKVIKRDQLVSGATPLTLEAAAAG